MAKDDPHNDAITALDTVIKAIRGLSDIERQRVLDSAAKFYDVKPKQVTRG